MSVKYGEIVSVNLPCIVGFQNWKLLARWRISGPSGECFATHLLHPSHLFHDQWIDANVGSHVRQAAWLVADDRDIHEALHGVRLSYLPGLYAFQQRCPGFSCISKKHICIGGHSHDLACPTVYSCGRSLSPALCESPVLD